MPNQETKDYLSMVDNVAGVLGSKNDEEIENAIIELTEVKEYLSTIKDDIQASINRENQQNETILNLRKANNKLMRQVAISEEEKTKLDEEIDKLDKMRSVF